MYPDLTQYLWILWLVIVITFVIIELSTLEFTFLMLAAGALLGGLGGYLLNAPWWLQIGAAAIVSALLLFTIRPLLLKLLHRNAEPARTNVDALAGQRGRVIDGFVEGSGTVKLDNGETWTARDESDDNLEAGAPVHVVRIVGATAFVARWQPTPGADAPSAPDPSAP